MAELSTKPLTEMLDDLEKATINCLVAKAAPKFYGDFSLAEAVRLLVREQIELRFKAMFDAIAAGVDMPEIHGRTRDIVKDMEAAEL